MCGKILCALFVVLVAVGGAARPREADASALLEQGKQSVADSNRVAAEANEAALEKLPWPVKPHHHGEISLEYEGAFPNLPGELLVYKGVKGPNVTEQYVREFGRRHFGIGSKAKLEHPPGMSYRLWGDKWLVQMWPGEGFTNLDEALTIEEKVAQYRKWRSQEASLEYPSEQQCREIATKFLQDHNLMPPDAYFGGVADNRHSSFEMSVAFGRIINGYKNWGPGGQIIVYVGPGGKVRGLLNSWQEIVPYKRYPLKTVEDALEQLRAGKGRLSLGSKGKIKNIGLRYYCLPYFQEYIQPVYFFECVGAKREFYGIVPAIKDEYLLSWEETVKPRKLKAMKKQDK